MQDVNSQTPPREADAIQYAAFLAIDWADEQHVYSLLVAGQSKPETGTLEQKPEVIGPWVARLRERFQGHLIAVAVEQSRGALLHALLSYDFLVIYPLHPNTVAKFREAFKSSGAKSDPLDASQILQILTKHREQLRPLEPDTEPTRLLRRLVEDRRKAVDLRTRHTQALQANLKEYYPQVLELCSGDVTTRLAADLLKKWPSMPALQQAKPSTLRRFYYGHQVRRPETLERVLALAQNGQMLTCDPPIVEAGQRLAQMYSQLIQALNEHIDQYDERIAQVFAGHPEAQLFQGLPGGGEVMAPRLLAFFGTDRARFAGAEGVQSFTGIAPVTQRSGKSHVVYARRACPKFDRQTFHEFARVSIRSCVWAQSYVAYYTAKDKPYHVIIRALAYKWIRILYRCWQSRTPYEESKYLETLRKRGVHYLAAAEANNS
jgi:transposase